jgi:hypothetical protein
MSTHNPRLGSILAWVLLAVGPAVSLGCSSSDSAKPATAQPEAQTAAAPAPAASAPVAPVDACTLLTKADVESLAGKAVLAGRKEEAGPLVTCSFDDPTAPQVGGRAISQVLTLAVMTGQEGAYYAGASAQAKDSLEIARKNSASDETVAGLGDAAYWDKILRRLSLASGRYLVTVSVQDNNLTVAKAAAVKALAKLPK